MVIPVVCRVLRKRVYVIDVGQSVDTLHPMWEQFLKRDIHNILVFFGAYLKISSEEAEMALFEGITQMKQTSEEFISTYVQEYVCLL